MSKSELSLNQKRIQHLHHCFSLVLSQRPRSQSRPSSSRFQFIHHQYFQHHSLGEVGEIVGVEEGHVVTDDQLYKQSKNNRRHNHKANALDILNILTKTPYLYLVPELRYPCHCCYPCHCRRPCRYPPPHCPPPHRHHHHEANTLDVLTKTPVLYLI